MLMIIGLITRMISNQIQLISNGSLPPLMSRTAEWKVNQTHLLSQSKPVQCTLHCEAHLIDPAWSSQNNTTNSLPSISISREPTKAAAKNHKIGCPLPRVGIRDLSSSLICRDPIMCQVIINQEWNTHLASKKKTLIFTLKPGLITS